MTIIEYMRQKLTEYPKISEFLTGDDIHIDLQNRIRLITACPAMVTAW